MRGILRVFEGCCRVFEGCLKKKKEAWNQSDPLPPVCEKFHKKSLIWRMMASLLEETAFLLIFSFLYKYWCWISCGWWLGVSRHQLWIGTIGKPVRILSRGLVALASSIIIIMCGRTSAHTLIIILSFIIINILCLTLVLVSCSMYAGLYCPIVSSISSWQLVAFNCHPTPTKWYFFYI